MAKSSNGLSSAQQAALMATLKTRFEKNRARHKGVDWANVEEKLLKNPGKLFSLNEMERTGGEPDVVALEKQSDAIVFIDCSAESPAGRRSYCYDLQAWKARKEHKPKNNALDVAREMGAELLSETQYRQLQELGEFDCKTSSWVLTPPDIRKLGGALFCDRRYGKVFVYHNGADSYYAVRGFRVAVRV